MFKPSLFTNNSINTSYILHFIVIKAIIVSTMKRLGMGGNEHV